MRRRQAARRRAFTLVETVAAIVLLAVAMPPMIWSIREAHLQRVSPVLTSRARWLATAKLETIIADRHSTTRDYAWLLPANYPDESSITGYPGFTRRVILTETEADLVTAGSGYMNVTVEVSWTDPAGNARTLSIATILTEYTP